MKTVMVCVNIAIIAAVGVACSKRESTEPGPAPATEKESGGLRRIFALQSKIDQKLVKSGADSLSRPELVFLCVEGVENEVNNGGFSQYFFNPAGDFAQDAAGASAISMLNTQHLW